MRIAQTYYNVLCFVIMYYDVFYARSMSGSSSQKAEIKETNLNTKKQNAANQKNKSKIGPNGKVIKQAKQIQ